MSPSTEKPCWYLYPYLYGYLYRKVKKSRWSSDRKSTRSTRLWRFTFDQFEVNHVGVHALALHTCSFAGLEPLQLLAGDTTKSLFVLATQRTSRYWTPTPQDTEHWNHICRCMFNRRMFKTIATDTVASFCHHQRSDNEPRELLCVWLSVTNEWPWTGEPFGAIAVRFSSETLSLRFRPLFGIAEQLATIGTGHLPRFHSATTFCRALNQR